MNRAPHRRHLGRAALRCPATGAGEPSPLLSLLDPDPVLLVHASWPRYRCVDLEELRVGPFVCGDAWNPALVHLAALDEALIFVFSACSPQGGMGTELSSQEGWRRSNRFYATMYGNYVLFVNRVGAERDLTFWGRSEIVNPFGDVVAAADGDEEMVVVGELDLALVRKARTCLHTVRDENPSFIQRRMTDIIRGADCL